VIIIRLGFTVNDKGSRLRAGYCTTQVNIRPVKLHALHAVICRPVKRKRH